MHGYAIAGPGRACYTDTSYPHSVPAVPFFSATFACNSVAALTFLNKHYKMATHYR
jgi:hypothetical protein